MADTTPSSDSAREALRALLTERGYRSVFDIVRQRRDRFIASLGERDDGAAIYAAAERRAAEVVRVRDALLARQEPASRSLRKLGSDNNTKRLGQLGLSDGFDYEHWFADPANQFVADDSVASLFSPASYLVDLYRAAITLHGPDSELNLAKRRPDIGSLALSQAKMDNEVSTLDIAVGILQTEASENALANATYPFTLPYDATTDVLCRSLRTLESTPWEIARSLMFGDHRWYLDIVGSLDMARFQFEIRFPPGWARIELGLSPLLYERLSTAASENDPSTVDWWGTGTTIPIIHGSEFLMRTGLSTTEVHELLASGHEAPSDVGAWYINAGGEPLELKTGAGNDPVGRLEGGGPSTFERIQRMVRLRAVSGFSFDDIDRVCKFTAFSDGDPLGQTLPWLAQLHMLKGRVKTTSDEWEAFLGNVSTVGRPGEPSPAARIFGPDIDPLIDTVIDFESASPNDALSGRARSTLCRALAIDDTQLRKLVHILVEGCKTFGLADKLKLDTRVLSALYRPCFVARRSGFSIDQLLSIWTLMTKGSYPIAAAMLSPAVDNTDASPFNAPVILFATMELAGWLVERKLPVDLILAMSTTEHSPIATPEIIDFLSGLRNSTATPPALTGMDASDTTQQIQQLARHVASAFGLKASVARPMLAWMDRRLAKADPLLKGYSAAAFWADIHSAANPPPSEAIVYCRVLAQFAIACQFTGLTQQDIELMVAPATGPSPLNGDDPPALDLSGIYWLVEYATWRDALPGSASEALQHVSQAAAGDDFLQVAEALAMLHGWDPQTTRELVELLPGGSSAAFRDWYAIVLWMRATTRYRLSPAALVDLDRIASGASADNGSWLAQQLLTAAHAKTRREGLNEALSGAIAEAHRDALVGWYIHNKVPADLKPKIKNAGDLYEYLLLDTQVTSVLKTSYIAEAIASVQLYINRCREGLEPYVDAVALAALSREGGYLTFWNAYFKRYGTWAGLQRLLLYPAAYIEPALRYRKSGPFRALEDKLSERKLTAQSAEAAFLRFVHDTAAMLDLVWLDGFQVGGPDGPSWFLAQDTAAAPRYYWRHSGPRTDEQTGHWTDWTPINAPVRPMLRRASIVYFAGKVRIAWLELKELRLGTDLVGSLWPTSAARTEGRIVEAYVPPPLARNTPTADNDEEFMGKSAMAAFFMLATRQDDDSWVVTEYPLEATPLDESHLIALVSAKWFYVSTYPGTDGEHLIAVISDTKDDSADQVFTRVIDIDARLVATDASANAFDLTEPGYGDRLVRAPLSVGDETYKALGLLDFLEVTTKFVNEKLWAEVKTAKAVEHFRIYVRIDGHYNYYVDFWQLKAGETKSVQSGFDAKNSTVHGWYCKHESHPYFGDMVRQSNVHESTGALPYLRNCYNGGWTYLDVPEGNDYLSLSTHLTADLVKRVDAGIDSVLDYEVQTTPREPPTSWSIESRSLSFHGAVGVYTLELFFHAPFLIACRLLDEQRFDEAETWLRRLFSPSGYVDTNGEARKDIDGNPLCWNVRPLQEDTTWGGDPIVDVDDPDAMAAGDPMHYKLAVFLRWLRLYVDRGDAAYRQQTRESLGEAKMWYMRAAQMLGSRPRFHAHPADLWTDPQVEEAASMMSGVLANIDTALVSTAGKAMPTPGQIALHDGPFLPPVNTAVLHWWDLIDLRLYNLRHGLSLDGLPLLVPLYDTPVDPRALQYRRIAADAGNAVFGSDGTDVPPHRFPVMLDRTRAVVQALMHYGAGLQSALERRDSDSLSVLQQKDHVALFDLIHSVHERNIESIGHSIESTQIARKAAQERSGHFARLASEVVNPLESGAMVTRGIAGGLVAASAPAFIIAGGLDMAPNIFIGGTAVGTGGSKWGGIVGGIANSLALIGQALESTAANMEVGAGYQRRAEDWQREALEAKMTESSLEKQELAQRKNLEAARRQLAQMEAEHAQAQGVLDVLGSRFTSEALYNWQAARLSTLYYQLYDACLGMCAQTQSAYAFETGDSTLYIKPGAWDDRYQGLQAGEHLTLSLQRLEQAWMERDSRAMEIERTFALSSLAVDASLPELIAEALTGAPRLAGGLSVSYDETQEILHLAFPLADAKLTDDYPDNMGVGGVRRIKSVAVTLPALLGPYEDVRAVLSYSGGVASSLPQGCSAVAVSRGLADSGQFVLDFHDGRYLPFEGIPIGDSGTFGLSFPNTAARPQEDMLRSITDVILHIRYTAKTATG